jgi:threonyl-tRNA synthetase
MHGLMRVRGFTQDDAHIFCTEDQIEAECAAFIALLSSVYKDLGFEKFDIKLSTRPDVRVGSDDVWDKAEGALQKAIEGLRLPYEVAEGDGAGQIGCGQQSREYVSARSQQANRGGI